MSLVRKKRRAERQKRTLLKQASQKNKPAVHPTKGIRKHELANRCPDWKFERARKFAKKMTSAEQAFWDHIGKPGFRPRFRPQMVILGYIVDFYCNKYKLAIEIDGGYHLSSKQIANDLKRDLALKNAGIAVLRFPNTVNAKQVRRNSAKLLIFVGNQKNRLKAEKAES